MRDRCLLLLMFRHGLRVSEACRMKYEETGGWGMSPSTCRQIVTCRAWTSKPSLISSRRRSPAPSPTHLIFVVFMIGSLHRRVMSSLGASKVPDWEIASRRKV